VSRLQAAPGLAVKLSAGVVTYPQLGLDRSPRGRDRELERCAGSQFDPQVVAVLVRGVKPAEVLALKSG
jgi:hypothetical protein